MQALIYDTNKPNKIEATSHKVDDLNNFMYVILSKNVEKHPLILY